MFEEKRKINDVINKDSEQIILIEEEKQSRKDMICEEKKFKDEEEIKTSKD